MTKLLTAEDATYRTDAHTIELRLDAIGEWHGTVDGWPINQTGTIKAVLDGVVRHLTATGD